MSKIKLSVGIDSFYDREFKRRRRDPNDFQPDSIFVIMSFKGQEMQEVYLAIKNECEKVGLTATRVDESIGSGFIIREIIDLIERSEFIICDLTYERPNVYYELGYAHGIGNQAMNILLTAREGTVLHFDIAPLRVQYYQSTDHLRLILAENLREMIIEWRTEISSLNYDSRIKEAEEELRIARFDKLAAEMSAEGLECPHCQQYSQHMSYRPRSARYPFFVCDICGNSFTYENFIKIEN